MNPKFISVMEELQCPSGAFIAAPGMDYRAVWLRDHLYCILAYVHTGDTAKVQAGMQVIFEIFRHQRRKIQHFLACGGNPHGVIHAKYCGDTLSEITNEWGHHQLDALGLFLWMVGLCDQKGFIEVGSSDRDMIQEVVNYLWKVAYWYEPDLGMWEACYQRHASSIGAVVAGLRFIRDRKLAKVPDELIDLGLTALHDILPYESRDRCATHYHEHDTDAALFTLIWPFQIIPYAQQEEFLQRLQTKLGQRHGFNRFWGDDYYRSFEREYAGVSGEWPMFTFWNAIIYAERGESAKADHWYRKGLDTTVGDRVPELYHNGQPNTHSPLAWAQAIAAIATVKLGLAE